MHAHRPEAGPLRVLGRRTGRPLIDDYLAALNVASPDCAEAFFNPHVARFFRGLRDAQLLPRLQVTAVRLLGCETGVTESGQRTLRMLAQTLRLPVHGTLAPLLKSHSNATGFDPSFTHLLVEASSLT